MPFTDLGKKYDSPEVAPSTKESPKVSYPSLHLDMDAAPDLKIGETFEAKVKLTCTGFRKQDYGNKKFCVDFDVNEIDLGAGPAKKTKGEELSDMVAGEIKEMDRD